MAIRVLQSSIVANYEVTASSKFHAGDGLGLDTTNGNYTVALNGSAMTYALWAGLSLADHNVTGNTFIQNDPVGSSVVSADGSTFTSYANGFYVGTKRAIGDFQDETASVVANLTDTGPTPKRGVGCLKADGSQFVTDRYTVGTSITVGTPLFVKASATLDTGGKLIDTAANNGVSVARADYYDATAGLVFGTLYVTGVAAA